MTARARALTLLVALAASCEETVEPPGITPASETLWGLLDLQLKLDAARPAVAALHGRTAGVVSIDRLAGEVAATIEMLTADDPTTDVLRSARYRADLIGLGYDLIRVDAEASVRGMAGALRSTTNFGIKAVWAGLDEVDKDPLWPVRNPVDADRLLLRAVTCRDNALTVAPVANIMKAGVQAAAITSTALSLAQLTAVGLPALARVSGFVRSGAGAPVLLEVGYVGGLGGVRVLAGTQSVVLTTEEVVALAKAGVISTAALAVYMAASETHHICSDKNSISDREGGPWTPDFEKIFGNAGIDLNAPENLIKVEGHKGPHPRAYHEAVFERVVITE